jgi:hypothetical protein
MSVSRKKKEAGFGVAFVAVCVAPFINEARVALWILQS